MTTVRELMTAEVRCIGEGQTLVEAAQLMKELDVGALPVCGTDDRLKGMVTDRDIVLQCVATGSDPASTTAGDLAQGKPVTIGVDDPAERALAAMAEHQVRRLPVISDQRLVGIVSQADVARAMPENKVGQVVEAISS